jgi:hypothetical protein
MVWLGLARLICTLYTSLVLAVQHIHMIPVSNHCDGGYDVKCVENVECSAELGILAADLSVCTGFIENPETV